MQAEGSSAAQQNPGSPSYNIRSPGVKRLMHEANENKNPTEQFWAQPLEDNLFEWHFTIAGPPGTEFEGGLYHGRITLPTNYPLAPPSFILITPNGRFEVNKKICLSISGHHPESWQPSWSIRTALVALIAFLPTPGAGAIGSLDYPAEERKKLAIKSRTFTCPECGAIANQIPKSEPVPTTATATASSTENTAENQQPENQQQTQQNPEQTSSATGPNVPPTSFMPMPPTDPLMVPPPFVAANYLPWFYQAMFTNASYYAHQAAVAAVVAGTAQQRIMAAHIAPVDQNRQQPQQRNDNPAPPMGNADIIAQFQHRERRSSAVLFAVILVAWAVYRFLELFADI